MALAARLEGLASATDEFLSTVRRVLVSSEGAALVQLHDGRMFALGCSRMWLGADVPDNESTIEPTEVKFHTTTDEVAERVVLGGHSSSDPAGKSRVFVMVLTASGHLFSCGNNKYGQLGTGSTVHCNRLVTVRGLSDSRVLEVACGDSHVVALTDNGEVFCWGYNESGRLGLGSRGGVYQPQQVNGGLYGKRVVEVGAGAHFSVALDSAGVVYTWGNNANGELATRDIVQRAVPFAVSHDASFAHIACAKSSLLAVCTEGKLYLTGSLINARYLVPYSPIPPVSRVLASPLFNFGLLQTVEDGVFAFGAPLEPSRFRTAACRTRYASCIEAFAFETGVLTSPCELDGLPRKPNASTTLAQTMSNAFDDPELSDLSFVLEDRPIHVHRSVVMLRCAHLCRMLSGPWEEAEGSEVVLTQYSYDAFHALLRYFYTDTVDVSPFVALEVMDIANAYGEETVKRLCEAVVMKSATTENVVQLLLGANRFNCPDLARHCQTFIVDHFKEVATRRDFLDLIKEPDLAFAVFNAAADKNVFRT